MKDHNHKALEVDKDEIDDLNIAFDRLNDASDVNISGDDLRKALGLSD